MNNKILIVLALLPMLAGCASSPWYDHPPETPVNMSPGMDENIVVNAKTRFIWKEAARAVHYDFHVFNRSNGSIQKYYLKNLVPEEICSGGICSITLAISLPSMKSHAWRVRAGNNAGKSAWNRNRFNMVNIGSGSGKTRTSQASVLLAD